MKNIEIIGEHLVEFEVNLKESLSRSIQQDLEQYTHLTLDLFLWSCRKNFELHFKDLQNQTEIKFLKLCTDRGDGFELVASRYENEEEKEARIKHLKECDKSTVENVKYYIREIQDCMDSQDISDITDMLTEMLNKLKTKDVPT